MPQKIFCLLVRHLSFTKFIVLLYYSHVIKGAIANITLRNGLGYTINGFGGNTCTCQGDHLLDGGAAIEIAPYVETRSAIANLETTFTLSTIYDKPLKIMPLGDSITHGVIGVNDSDSGGYRTELWHKFVADGLKVSFVGSQCHGPDSLSNRNHEGHSGWTIRQIAGLVIKGLNTFQPDIVLLMIGTNDTRKHSVRTMITELSTLIDQITAHSPNVQILVASIPPIHPAKQPLKRVKRAVAFNQAIPSIVKFKVAQGKKVDFVDMRNMTVNDLTSSLSLDLDNGLHPNAQGYSKIANHWHDAVFRATANRLNSSADLNRKELRQSYVTL